MAKLKLTKTTVEALPFTSKGQSVYFDVLLTGFGVYVGKTSKTYFAQRQVGTKTRRVTIGRHGVFTTEQARAEARNLLLRMAQGEDPNAEKRRRRLVGVTLSQVLDLYLQARRNLRAFTHKTYQHVIDVHLEDWRDLPLAEITPAMVLDRHTKLGEEVGQPAANNTM